MKIRTGFVSNSSSSSFVIGLKQRPKTVGELHTLLFRTYETQVLRPDWIKEGDAAWDTFKDTSYAVAENIFNQIEDQEVVPDSLLAKICDPGKYPEFPFWDDVREGKPLKEKMKKRYAIEHPYCISPTNRLWKKARQIEDRGRVRYNVRLAEMRKERWNKIAPMFKGLKKFVIMTQSDGGQESRILAIMEFCWPQIARNVQTAKLTSH